MPTNNVAMSITDPSLTSQMLDIQRRQKLAQALQQQAMEPMGGTQFVGNVAVKRSPVEGLAKMLQAWGASRMEKSADDQYAGLLDQQSQNRAAMMDQVTSAINGGDRRTAMAALLRSGDANMQAMGGKLMEDMLKGNSEAFGKVDPSNYTPESVAKFAQTRDYSALVPVRKMEVASNGQVINPWEIKPGTVLPDPNKPFSVGENGPVPNVPFQNFEINKSRAGASNVSVNTAQKPFLNKLGEGAAEAVLTGANQAQQATQTLANVQQMRSGLGNAIVGPGANARIGLAQIGEVLGINGKNSSEQLQNTRNVIQGLARQELAAAGQMKGQGQITESERAILRKAESGQINELTSPEITTLLAAMEKTANYRIASHQQNMERLKADPNSAQLVDYLNSGSAGSSQQPSNKAITVDY